jgi:hypothetical protein
MPTIFLSRGPRELGLVVFKTVMIKIMYFFKIPNVKKEATTPLVM